MPSMKERISGFIKPQIEESNSNAAYFKVQPVEHSMFTEQFKGEVTDTQVKFPKELGVAHPTDFKLMEGVYTKFGLVTGIIDKFVDFVVGPGITVTSEDANAQQIIENFMRDTGFDSKIREWARLTFITGNGFMEIITDENQPVGLKVLDSATVFVKRDKVGKILGYNQFLGNVKKFTPSDDRDKIIPFAPEEIAHAKDNSLAGAAYGLGKISPNIDNINNFLSVQKDMHTLIKRKANSPLFVKMGSPERPPNPADITNMGKDLEVLNVKHEFATGPLVEPKVVDFGNVGDKYEGVIKNDLHMILAGFQVPEVLMTSGQLNEGIADVQLESFQRNVQSKQEELEKIVEEHIFLPVLQSQGVEAHVEIIWGQPSPSERRAKAERLMTLLASNSLASENLRFAAEVEIAKLLDLDVEIDPEAERDEEENEVSQPKVPGTGNTDKSLLEEEIRKINENLFTLQTQQKEDKNAIVSDYENELKGIKDLLEQVRAEKIAFIPVEKEVKQEHSHDEGVEAETIGELVYDDDS